MQWRNSLHPSCSWCPLMIRSPISDLEQLQLERYENRNNCLKLVPSTFWGPWERREWTKVAGETAKKWAETCLNFNELQQMGRRKRGLFRLDREHSTAFHSPSAHSQWGYLKDVPSPNTALNQSSPADRHAEVIHPVGQATGPKAGVYQTSRD